MLEVLRSWVERYLSNEEALLLAVLVVGGLVVVVTMGAIIAPLITGLVLAFVLQGVIKSLERRGTPSRVAVALAYLLFLGGAFTVLFFVVPRVWRQMQNLFTEMPALLESTRVLLEGLPARYPGFVSEDLIRSWVEMLQGEAGNIGQWVLSASLSQLPLLVAIVVYTLLVPILVFFFLKDKDLLLGWALNFLPPERPLLNRIGQEMNLQMANYVRGKFVEVIITGSATYAVFVWFGMNYAALLAVLVGLSVIVPYVGVAAVSVPVVAIAYIQFGPSGAFFLLMFGYTLIQALDGFVLVPLIFSEVVNLHPVAIIAAILVFGSFWGLWGVFFAIPLATLIKAIMSAWPRSGIPAAASEAE